MHQSTLLRRVSSLVIGALAASMFIAMIAFFMAGRRTTMDMEINSALDQNRVYYQLFELKKDFFDNPDYSDKFFQSTSKSKQDFYLLDGNDRIIGHTPESALSVTKEETEEALQYFRDSDKTTFGKNLYHQTIDSSFGTKKLLIIVQTVTYGGETAYLVSITVTTAFNDVVQQFLNILVISTLLAGMLMMIPAYLFIRRIILPIQSINNVAVEYSKGNYNVRADESDKGEVGELGASFNTMADRLSRSISDITTERNRLQDIFDIISDGIVVVDENSNPIIVNKAIHTIFDRAEANNMFTERLQLIPFDEVWKDFDECISTEESKNRTILDRDYAYQITIIPKFDDDTGECIGATGFFRDIYNEQRNEQFRRDYVANISHELRTPLQTLRGLIEPLADGMVKSEEDRKRYYNIILDETMRLSRLITDMLELSKLQSGTMAMKTFPFDLNNLISDLEIKMRPIIEEAGLNFNVIFNSGHLPTVMGNPDRVEQILIILLDNAKKYTPPGKSITIMTDYIEAEKKVYVSVADTGQGIHEYDINNIFDRFFKADRARGKKGTGLGLSIAKELLTYMGETIKVTSKYGEGSTFTFTLSKAEAGNAWE
ncbi:MAG: HAMP domain-containing protein [Clostridiales bacterium]|nr:HAMP domain-containing protein [Clostridiales bacterium]